jgi:hypothetical protein
MFLSVAKGINFIIYHHYYEFVIPFFRLFIYSRPTYLSQSHIKNREENKYSKTHPTLKPTLLLVPTSNMTGSVCSGGIPPKAVYKANFPTGIPIP